MGTVLRVNNLSHDTTVEDLLGLCGGLHSLVGARISVEEGSGLSKGYGFIKLETAEAASAALLALNGRQLKGREIRVVVARKPASGPRPGKPPRIAGTE